MKKINPTLVLTLVILTVLGIFNQWTAFAVVAVCFNITTLLNGFVPKEQAEASVGRKEFDELRSTVNATAMRLGVQGFE